MNIILSLKNIKTGLLQKSVIPFLSLLFLPMMTCCYADFEPDLKSTPVVCINANAIVGDTLKIFVTRTWRYSEGSPDKNFDVTLRNADVKLYVNDKLFETVNGVEWEKTNYTGFFNETKFGYVTNYIPSPGDMIKITATDPEYGYAEGEVEVPFPVEIDKITSSWINTLVYDYGYFVHYYGDNKLNIWFTDPEDTQNFYLVEAKRGKGNSWDTYFNIDFTPEPLFTEHVSPLESLISETSGYTIFTDRQISGKSYPLHINITDVELKVNKEESPDQFEASVRITLRTISESYYKHVLSVWVAEDGIAGSLGSIGLGEQVWESSNVSTGAGVISASAPTHYDVNLTDILQK